MGYIIRVNGGSSEKEKGSKGLCMLGYGLWLHMPQHRYFFPLSFFLFNIFTCNILMVYYVDNMLLWYQLVSLQPSLKKNGIRFLFTTVGILSCQNNIFLFWLKIITKFRFLYVQNEDRPEPHALWVSHWLQILLGRLVLISQTGMHE